MNRLLICQFVWAVACFQGALCFQGAFAQEQSSIVLKNGMVLKGQVNTYPTLDESGKRQSNSVSAQPLYVVDDGMRLTFFHNQLRAAESPAEPLFTIMHRNAKSVDKNGKKLNGILSSQGTPFDEHGRRVATVSALSEGGGPIELLQGITEISPQYMKVETLKMANSREWQMYVSIQSINRKMLVRILENNADKTSQQDWLDIVSLLNQARMYPEAIDVLDKAIGLIPEMESHRKNFAIFAQSFADQMFDEVELRRSAGQYELAAALLRGFKPERLSLETKLKIEKRLQSDEEEIERFKRIATQLREQVKQLQDPAIQVVVSPLIDEIAKNLSPNSIDRLVDYDRMREDPGMTVDQKISIAISGWLLGPGNQITSINIAKSLIEARDLVMKYLASGSDTQRRELMQQIKKLEAGAPRYIGPMVAKILPVLPLPEPQADHPSRYWVEMSLRPLEGETSGYYVQLPPQYDPYRSYPCILALHSGSEENEINWWAGRFNKEMNMAAGEAARHGYIVVAPRWNGPKDRGYRSTENEHLRALAALRDAMRRASIDANRVFVAGHYEGATMAWDLALSHPDLWAGAVCIGPNQATNYVKHYRESARYVPLYFVCGAMDGVDPKKRIGAEIDDYAQSSIHDFLYVEYQGRGRDHFVEELSRIMQWMDLPSHVRIPPPERKVSVRSSRPGDSFYWWLEINDFSVEQNHPLLEFDPKRVANIKFERVAAANTLTFESLPAKKYTIWLEPSMIDFTKKIKIREKKERTVEATPSVEVLLEDVRMRADRQRPFWAKID